MDYKSVLQNVYSVTSSLENANVRVIQEKAKIVLPWWYYKNQWQLKNKPSTELQLRLFLGDPN